MHTLHVRLHPPGMLAVNHSQRETRIYILLWLFREVIAKKQLPASSVFVCPSSYQQETMDFRENIYLWFVLKFEDETKFDISLTVYHYVSQ
jgi:CRISPR/Cas system CSM-associated protein Csm4 (group 5 of RAMP superfamily)